MSYDQYRINVEKISEYIEYLSYFKRTLENELIDFEKRIKAAHDYWDDEQYEKTLEVKDEISRAEMELIESIEDSIRKLTIMNEEYIKYLRM